MEQRGDLFQLQHHLLCAARRVLPTAVGVCLSRIVLQYHQAPRAWRERRLVLEISRLVHRVDDHLGLHHGHPWLHHLPDCVQGEAKPDQKRGTRGRRRRKRTDPGQLQLGWYGPASYVLRRRDESYAGWKGKNKKTRTSKKNMFIVTHRVAVADPQPLGALGVVFIGVFPRLQSSCHRNASVFFFC